MSQTISVIVPVYNVLPYLEKCLDSIRGQTWTDFEVLLVDDGSSDGSETICDIYENSDERFHVIHQKNAGASAARNTALRLASGRFVTFIDSDDWVEPEYLETLISEFNKHADTSDVVLQMCTMYKNVDELYYPLGVRVCRLFHRADALSFIISDKLSGPWTKLFLSDRIRERKLLFDTSISVGEDLLFVFEYLKGGTMSYTPRPIYHYRQSDNSISRSKFKLSRMTLFDALDRIEKGLSDDFEQVRPAIQSKRVYASFVSMLLLLTTVSRPDNVDGLKSRLKGILWKGLPVFIKSRDYIVFEKLAVALVAISPTIGAKLYSMLYHV